MDLMFCTAPCAMCPYNGSMNWLEPLGTAVQVEYNAGDLGGADDRRHAFDNEPEGGRRAAGSEPCWAVSGVVRHTVRGHRGRTAAQRSSRPSGGGAGATRSPCWRPRARGVRARHRAGRPSAQDRRRRRPRAPATQARAGGPRGSWPSPARPTEGCAPRRGRQRPAPSGWSTRRPGGPSRKSSAAQRASPPPPRAGPPADPAVGHKVAHVALSVSTRPPRRSKDAATRWRTGWSPPRTSSAAHSTSDAGMTAPEPHSS